MTKEEVPETFTDKGVTMTLLSVEENETYITADYRMSHSEERLRVVFSKETLSDWESSKRKNTSSSEETSDGTP